MLPERHQELGPPGAGHSSVEVLEHGASEGEPPPRGGRGILSPAVASASFALLLNNRTVERRPSATFCTTDSPDTALLAAIRRLPVRRVWSEGTSQEVCFEATDVEVHISRKGLWTLGTQGAARGSGTKLPPHLGLKPLCPSGLLASLGRDDAAGSQHLPNELVLVFAAQLPTGQRLTDGRHRGRCSYQHR